MWLFATFDQIPQIWPKPPKTPVLGGVKFGQISTPWRGVKFGSKVPKVPARAPLAILFFWMPKVNQSLIRGGYPNTPPFRGGSRTPPTFGQIWGFPEKTPNLMKLDKFSEIWLISTNYLFFYQNKKINNIFIFDKQK